MSAGQTTDCYKQYSIVLASPAICVLRPDLYVLRHFKPPPLLQVSQQVRSEAKGLLTADNEVHLHIRSNYVALNNDGTPTTQDYWHQHIGLLQLDEDRKKWLVDNNAVFRNISLEVHCASWWHRRIGKFFIGGPLNNKLTSRWIVFWPYAPNFELLQKMFTHIAEDIDKVVKEAEGRTGFAGLNLTDLEKIAKCFDYTKRQ